MFVAVDVGNSGVKAGLFAGDELLAAARIPPGASLRDVLPVPSAESPPVVAVSVSEPALAELLAAMDGSILVLGRDLPILVPNRYRDPAEVGRDRLVAAAAAHGIARGPAVVVDAGSAVTVDAVDGEGAFLGGAIAPGRRAMVLGLAEAAPALPPVGGEPPPTSVPRSTAEALAAGVWLGLAGLVDRLVEGAAQALATGEEEGGGGPASAVILTGGDGERLQPHLARPSVLEPHLTLHGVRILFERAEGKPCT